MRIAVLSDIHANLPALRAVLQHLDAQNPDAVMVGGDVINRGPQPRECLEIILDRIRNHDWKIIRGNHEDYVLKAARDDLSNLTAWERGIIAHTCWTAGLVDDHLNEVTRWPENTEVIAPDGTAALCFHASIKGNRVGMYTHMQDHELLEHAHPEARVFCAGHTHIPFVRETGGKLIVNNGAVGMPFDGDPRASYAILDWSPAHWTAEIIRVPYDRDETRKAFRETGYLERGGPMVPLILQELDMAKARLGYWHRLFEQSVAAGEKTLEDSINEMMTTF